MFGKGLVKSIQFTIINLLMQYVYLFFLQLSNYIWLYCKVDKCIPFRADNVTRHAVGNRKGRYQLAYSSSSKTIVEFTRYVNMEKTIYMKYVIL